MPLTGRECHIRNSRVGLRGRAAARSASHSMVVKRAMDRGISWLKDKERIAYCRRQLNYLISVKHDSAGEGDRKMAVCRWRHHILDRMSFLECQTARNLAPGSASNIDPGCEGAGVMS
jgi:hypothetical protein